MNPTPEMLDRLDRITARGESVAAICHELQSVIGLRVDLAETLLDIALSVVADEDEERRFAEAQ